MDFNQYIQHPELLSRETLYDLRSYVAMYPCHQAARLLMLQNLYVLHDPTFDEELRSASFYINDRTALFNLVEARFYKLAEEIHSAPQKQSNDQDKLIDEFVDTAAKKEDESGKPSVIDATVDYMAYKMSLEGRQNDEKKTSGKQSASDIINSFLENEGGKITIRNNGESGGYTPHDDVAFENDKDDLQEDFYTESLAKVYIKQHNFSKALEIFKQLNLNNSEKSAYFADQMRFLEKVIAVNNRK